MLRHAIADAVVMFGNFLMICIVVRALLSWFPINPRSFIVTLLHTITEPFLSPIRKLINKSPLGGMMIDFSTIISIMLLRFLIIPILAGLIRG
jgi:YggT family protein